MKWLLIFVFIPFMSLAKQQNKEMSYQLDDNYACDNYTVNTNTLYKIHFKNEPLTKNGLYIFSITAKENVIPHILLDGPIFYPNNANIFKNRHGQILNIENEIGVYIQFANGIKEEVTSNAIALELNNTQDNVYGGKIFYQMKKDEEHYANGSTFVNARFKILCKAP